MARNSQYLKAIGDVKSFLQEESLYIKNNLLVLPHTAILERIYAVLEISENRRKLKESEACNSTGKVLLSFYQIFL
jgi:hypothetical protein